MTYSIKPDLVFRDTAYANVFGKRIENRQLGYIKIAKLDILQITLSQLFIIQVTNHHLQIKYHVMNKPQNRGKRNI